LGQRVVDEGGGAATRTGIYAPASRPTAQGGEKVACPLFPHWSAKISKVKLSWKTYDQPGDNEPIDDHPATPANGGKRIFPGKKEYDDSAEDAAKRRYVFAVVEFAEGADLPDTMYYRVWDVDDPSSDTAPIDENGAAGGDNLGEDEGEQRNGWHVADENGNHISDVTMGYIMRFVDDEGTEGEEVDTCTATRFVKCAVRVGMQPGDNWRFAVAWGDGASARLAAMTQPQADTRQPPDGVAESEMLTTWRKLHLELDHMAFGPDHNVVGRNLDDTYGPDVPHTGDSGAEINDWVCPDNGRYEGGTLYFYYGEPPFEIIDNEYDTGDNTVYVVGDITPYEDHEAGFYDDDYPRANGNPAPEYRMVDWSLVNEKFAPAYIEAVEDEEARDIDAPFIPTTYYPFDAAQYRWDEQTSPAYWVSLILAAHQSYGHNDDKQTIISSVDGDPDIRYHLHSGAGKDGDQGLWGGLTEDSRTTANYNNMSLIFLEPCRECAAWIGTGWMSPIYNCSTAGGIEQHTVVHELGHQFGWLDEGPEGTIMGSGADFNEDQINVFRGQDSIEW